MWIHWLKKVCYAALPCLKKLLNQKSVDDINGCTRWNVLLLPGPHLAEVLDPGPLDWQSVAVSWMTEKGESFGWKSLHTEADLCFSRPVQALSTDTIWRLVAAFWRTDSDSRWRIWEGNLEQVLVHGWFGIEAPGISSMGPCKSWRAVMLELENGTGHRMQSWCLVGSDSKFKRSNRELYDSDPGEQPSLSLSLSAGFASCCRRSSCWVVHRLEKLGADQRKTSRRRCWYWDVHLAGKWYWDGNPFPRCSRLKVS